MMWIRLAWRNMLRNKRRTLIAGTAIGIGMAAMIFVDALFEGMSRYMVRSATSSFLGEAQIHREGFRETLEANLTINGLDSVTAGLDATPIVSRYTVRTKSFAMISSPANMTGIVMVGVQPQSERDLSQIDDAMQRGTYFEGESERDIIIGSRLADLLEVDVADRVVVTATEAYTGNMSQELFRISGIYHFNIREMDEGMAFVRLSRAQKMLAIDGTAHEISIRFVDPTMASDSSLAFWSEFSTNGNEAAGWPDLLPEMKTILDMSDLNMLISAIILFGVVSLVIINTLFMSLYERMFEFGVLRAVGTSPFGLLRLVMFEAAALALISVAIGMIIGFGVSYWFAHVGIDYGNIEMAGVTIRDRIYPLIRWNQYVVIPAWAFVLTTIVGIYPALYAARLEPARAMRKSF